MGNTMLYLMYYFPLAIVGMGLIITCGSIVRKLG